MLCCITIHCFCAQTVRTHIRHRRLSYCNFKGLIAFDDNYIDQIIWTLISFNAAGILQALLAPLINLPPTTRVEGHFSGAVLMCLDNNMRIYIWLHNMIYCEIIKHVCKCLIICLTSHTIESSNLWDKYSS